MGRGQLEHLILSGLFKRPEFTSRALPYLKEDYFRTSAERLVFRKTRQFFDEYQTAPTPIAIQIELNKDTDLDEDDHNEAGKLLETIEKVRDDSDKDWLLDSTEEWCQRNALENALREGIVIFGGDDKKKRSWNTIPELVQNALSVSFDSSVGINFRDYKDRFKLYQENIGEQITCDITKLNEQTLGGFAKKTFNVFMGQTGVGKTLTMCSLAGGMLLDGHNVLYVSAEVADLKATQRIEAKLLDVSMLDLKEMTEQDYLKRMDRLDKQLTGQLYVKEYPTATASANDVRALLDELKLKQNFVPDVVFIDYLNIFRSARVTNAENTYIMIKNIAEEFRGLAVERNLCMISATQVTRSAFDASLLSLKDVPESKALVDTVDLLVGLLVPPELKYDNVIIAQTLKTRYMDSTQADTFAIGINRGRQQLYDLEDAQAPLLIQERSVEMKPKKKKRTLRN